MYGTKALDEDDVGWVRYGFTANDEEDLHLTLLEKGGTTTQFTQWNAAYTQNTDLTRNHKNIELSQPL